MFGLQASQADPEDVVAIYRMLMGCGPLEREVTGKEDEKGDGGGDPPAAKGETVNVGVHFFGDINSQASTINDPSKDQNTSPATFTLNQFNDDHVLVGDAMALMIPNGMMRVNDKGWFLAGLDVGGQLDIGLDLVLVGDLACGGDLAVTGDTTLTGTLGVTGDTTLPTVIVTGPFNAQAGVDCDTTFNVDGNTTLVGTVVNTGAVTMNGTLECNSTSQFDAKVHITSDLEVDGQTDIDGDLDVNSTSTFTGAAVFNGAATFNGTVTGAGNTTVFSQVIPYTDFSVAGVTKTVTTSNTLADGDFIIAANLRNPTRFVAASSTSALADFGDASSAARFISGMDVHSTSSDSLNKIVDVVALPYLNADDTTRALTVTLTSDVNLDTLTAGSITLFALIWTPS